ncbi:hypothetical protein LJC13_00490 [Peptostreptococcaceae bacterium OttesenSCG-928-C18]|nr:hypothetical protein [Peptostreptococcaceae bacterium OttesenSCG-928-C18]
MENYKLEQEVKIYESKIKNIGLFFLGVFMSILGLILILVGLKEPRVYILIVIGIMGLVFFGFCTIFIFSLIFKNEPVIILNKDGFFNKKQSYSKERPFILWNEVEEIFIKNIVGEDFVCIKIENEEKYIESMSKPMKLGAKANMKLGFPAICISANSLKGYNNDKLFNLFISYCEEYYERLEEELL